jgi:hypothetical protein
VSGFAVKDSGERQEFASGMRRDVTTGKVDYTLTLDGPMFERWAAHLTKGAGKYAPRNWMLADGDDEYGRFRESAFRHFIAWFRGDTDEDHAAAAFFNVNGAEYVKARPREIAQENRAAARPSMPELDRIELAPVAVGQCGYVVPESEKHRR